MKKPTIKKQDLIKSVVDNLPGLVFRVINDGEWSFEFASRGAMALLGYAPEKLVSAKAFSHMIPKKDQEENKRVLAKISMEKPHYEVIYRVQSDRKRNLMFHIGYFLSSQVTPAAQPDLRGF